LSPDIQIWCRLTEAVDDAEIQSASAVLSPDERERCRRFVRNEDRRDYAIAHHLLRTSLSRYASIAASEWEFEELPGGKPVIRPGRAGAAPLFFNLSHTRGVVACAIGQWPLLGVDVERMDREASSDAIARAHFCREEVERLRSCDASSQRSRFCELWTLKESYLKATGAGLSGSLSDVCFEFVTDSTLVVRNGLTSQGHWHFALFAVTDDARLAAAVCLPPPVSPRFDVYVGDGQSFQPVSCLRASAHPSASPASLD
jgi:4'-phosphopantetheinyl transferase